MKEAMWKVDPVTGATFADSTNSGQLVLFVDMPDLTPLVSELRAHFGTREFSIEEAARFTLVMTPFVPSMHLKPVLRSIEEAGHLTATHPMKARRRNTYPDGTLIRLTP
jgi:hypothetical protein